jgi:GNAT superfamily N-acetyltransferase
MDLKMRSESWADPLARQAFKHFMIEIHGLDFTAWESAGFWDYAYTPFSYFEEDLVVASVCIYMLDAVIDGREARLAQLSGVGTLPRWRRQGLNRVLTDTALEWARGKHEGIFLFSDSDAIPFYTKCGFKPVHEYVEMADVSPVPNNGGSVKLNPKNPDHLNKAYAYAKRRVAISNRLSILNAKLLMFHFMYILSDCTWEIPRLGCVVFYERKGDRLHIYDIVGERIPQWSELYPYISNDQDRTVHFHFFTDKLGLTGARSVQLQGNHPFVKGRFPVQNPTFPYTSRA